MNNHCLNEGQLKLIKEILTPYAQSIKKVGLFGSRATGKYRPNSDIDMVLYGDIDEAIIDRIWTLFDASNLPVSVDVTAYDLVDYPPLKAHIDESMRTLFSNEELLEVAG